MNKNRFNSNDKKKKDIITNTVIILLIVGCIGFVIAALYGGDEVEANSNKVNDKKSEVASKPTNDKKIDENKLEDKKEDKQEDKQEEENSSNTEDKETANSGDENTNSNPQAPAHTHSWVAVTSNVQHDEVGHFEEIIVSEPWTESIPVYESREIAICDGCGADITSDPWGHIQSQGSSENSNCSGFHSDWKQIQTGSKNVNHPAVYDKKWVVDAAAWNETVITGYKCNCGETK